MGKSTTAVNLAHGLAQADRRVLLIDADTQGQATAMLGIEPAHSLAEVVAGDIDALKASERARERLDVLGGGQALAGLAQEIARDDIAPQQQLAEAMEAVEGEYEYVIVDTAPGWDQLAINVLFYATEVLVPVSLEVLTLQSLGDYRQRLGRIQKYRNELELRYVLPTFLDGRVAKSGEILTQLESYFPDELLPPIRYNARLAEAPGHGETIFEYAPRSRGAEDYETLTNHLMHDEANE